MKGRDLVSDIEELGLSNKEARVYLACLSLPASSVQVIADRAGIKRVTAYVILDSLVALGLVRPSSKAKKALYTSEDPSNLSRLIDRRAIELTEQKLALAALLPKLSDLAGDEKDVSELKYHDGVEAVRKLYEDFITTNSEDDCEVLSFCNLDDLADVIGRDHLLEMGDDKVSRRSFGRLIYTNKVGPLDASRIVDTGHRMKYFHHEDAPFTGHISISGDRLIMLSLKLNHPIGVAIRSARIAALMRSVFDLAWASVEQGPRATS